MAHRYDSGFTIIETSLVMAVTGLLIAMVVTGIGSSLSHERYNDTVNQSLSLFRSQYSQTANVLNDRPSNEGCGPSGISATGVTNRGASNCLLLGTVLRSDDGSHISVYPVIARHDPSNDSGVSSKTDTQILVSSSLIQGNQTGFSTVEWGSTFLKPDSLDPKTFTIMTVRTPVSGTVETYVSESSTISVTSLLSEPQNDFKLCIDQSGFFGIGIKPMGILIQGGASNTTGVQTIASGECV